MSWSNKRMCRIAGPALGALVLSGCFQPLYQGGASVGGVSLASIAVPPISGRLGYSLTNELAFRFHGGGEVASPEYQLSVKLSEHVQTPLVDTVSGRATSAVVGIDANYSLVSSATQQEVASGTAFTTETYDRSSQRFANIRAARDAELRGARVLADQIFTRIAAALRAKG